MIDWFRHSGSVYKWALIRDETKKSAFFSILARLLRKQSKHLRGSPNFVSPWIGWNVQELALSVASFSLHTKNWKIGIIWKYVLYVSPNERPRRFIVTRIVFGWWKPRFYFPSRFRLAFRHIYPLFLASKKARSSLKVHVLTSPFEKKSGYWHLAFLFPGKLL